MKRYKIVVSYDGTKYHGWQFQPRLPSVVGVLQHSFAKVFHKNIVILGASRTDAGVHAAGQVATFTTDLAISEKQILFGWSNNLPYDVTIRSLAVVHETFNPRHDVLKKIYHYTVFLKRPEPFVSRYGWYYIGSIDQYKLEKALQAFVGTHDFTAFCAADARDTNRVRTIQSITVVKEPLNAVLQIEIVGQRFLQYMIRRIVGAALKVASYDHLGVESIQEVFALKSPNNHFPTAPAHGLLLYKVIYKNMELLV